ncbi:hypothetical protein PENSUB_10534 [Penicillium subrubescens]|uniref:Uncharacterized protein n=1 Tax=Penicillium subrubescens TaxID=1316194 RepID=A0A1Q5T7Z5_9EURO|nr:hypothetical protein PENSUB_10534 [Penicillium subrubescens]
MNSETPYGLCKSRSNSNSRSSSSSRQQTTADEFGGETQKAAETDESNSAESEQPASEDGDTLTPPVCNAEICHFRRRRSPSSAPSSQCQRQ